MNIHELFSRSKLLVVAQGLSGMGAAQVEETTKEAESKCPISNALRGSLTIDVEAEVR